MGIKDLLRFMKPFIKPIHIKKYAGKRVGIDAYSWLHKGAYSCSLELCQNSESEKKSRYLLYFMNRINLLRHHKVIPVVVFDGGNLPCKSDTEGERKKKRETNLALAREQLNQGNTTAAIELFQKAISITPSMAHQLIQILKSKHVEFVVAPYEADAQLAYLSNLDAEQGGIAAVITEDSDLMAYGCQSIIFKMDKYGSGEEILMDKAFNHVASIQEKKSSPDFVPSLQSFNKELFTGMCVLAGCDFLPSIAGIGIKRAYNLVSKYKNLDRVLSVLKLDKRYQMPDDYVKSFKQAVAVFHHARIFDPRTKTIKHMKSLPEELVKSFDGELDFLGPDIREIPSSIATAIAIGDMDPISMKTFDHFTSSATDFVIQNSDNFLTTDTNTQKISSTREKASGFTIFSSRRREDKMEVIELEDTVNEKKYLNELFALQKLVMPLELPSKTVKANPRIEYPDNNPFKKRKIDEQVSVVTEEIERDEILCLTPDSGDHVPLTTNDVLNKGEISDEIVCLTPKCEESVNSISRKKIVVGKVVEKNKPRLKKANTCKTSASNNTSILSFFARVKE